MKIKKNDKVKIISGKNRGKTGKVLEVRPKERKIVVEGVNLLWRHVRPRKSGEKGQRIQFPAPLSLAKAALICSKCNQTTRVSFKEVEKRKLRMCKKCKEVIE